MKKSISNYLLLTLVSFFIFNSINAQKFSESGINIGIKAGSSILLGEIKNDFSGIINEFNNKPGFAAGFEFSKNMMKHWELGGEFSRSVLHGNAYSPEFSAEGFQWGIPSEITEPVEYKNDLWSFSLLFRYYFKNISSESLFNPFVRFSGGYLTYNSTFKYIDAPDDEVIFGKGTEGATSLSTPVLSIGTGLKIFLSEKFYCITSFDLNFVNYDFLDVMHNYTSDGERLAVTGLYTEIKVGFYYNLHLNTRNKNKQGKSKKGKSSESNHLPFAH